MNVGIFGHYGNKNLGDEAIILAVIQNVKKRFPDAEISCFSLNPDDTNERYGVPSYPIRRGLAVSAQLAEADTDNPINLAGPLRKDTSPYTKIKNFLKKYFGFLYHCLRIFKRILEFPSLFLSEIRFLAETKQVLKTFDLLIISGSNQFLDNFGGAWGFPYTLFKWSVLAKVTKTRLAFVSIGAGPLDGLLSKMFIRGAVALSNYLSFRDIGSKRLTDGFLGHKNGAVYPDLAFSLSFADQIENKSSVKDKAGRIVGINPMPVYDARYWHMADELKYKEYVQKIGKFVVDIINEGHQVKLFSTHPKDELVSLDIIEYVSGVADISKRDVCLTDYPETVMGLMELIGSFDVVIATRFHGVVLSLLSHKNVIAICYGSKTRELMKEIGLEHFALDLNKFSTKKLVDCFTGLNEEAEIQKNAIIGKTDTYKKLLSEQYDSVFDFN